MSTSLVNNKADDDESTTDSSSDESDDSDNSSDSDSGESTKAKEAAATTIMKPSVGVILDLDNVFDSQGTIQFNKKLSSGSDIAEGLEGLVMAPLVAKINDISKPTNIVDESGAWKDFVRPDLSGGLYVKMRFVHGSSRVREAEIMGLDPKIPNTVCLQVHIENM